MMSRLHHDKEAVRYIDGRQYHDEPASRYPLPRDEQEADRLHEQHFVTKELLGWFVCRFYIYVFRMLSHSHTLSII